MVDLDKKPDGGNGGGGMSKEVVILGLIVIGAAAFFIGRASSDKADDNKATVTAEADEATAEKATAKDEAAPAKNDSDILPVGSSYAMGPATAPVTIIEFSEFQCPFCKRVNPTLDQIKKEYGDKVRVVFKHNPLSFHKDAPYAAKASLAAGKQGKFWEMHDKLFENQRAIKEDDIKGYAKAIGLDMAQFEKDVASDEIKKMVDADMKLAAKVGARGTPNFFINGEQLSGAQPFDRFKAVIDKQLEQAEEAIKAGTAPEAVYAAQVKKNFKEPKKAAPRKAADDKTVYKVPVGNSPGMGGSEPLVTIIAFSEFQCPFCKRVLPTLDTLKKDYGDKIRVVFKHNPLPFHKDAEPAARAAIAAGMQGKFWEMHDKLFQDTKALKQENLETYAKELGLDMAKWKADMDSDAAKKQIKEDQAIASQFGARGTPNFFINGRKLTGARPVASFKSVIDEEIKKAEALIAKGTPRAKVYEELTKNGATKAAAPAPRKRPAADDKTVYKVPVDEFDFAKGPADALVTIIEYSEFQCPFCKRVLPTMDQITKKYGNDVRIVFKHNPLPFHKDAPLASQASIAAGKQGKFWEMHDKLFENQKALKPDNIDAYAKEIGLDMAKFKADLESSEIKAAIAADQKLAGQIGARGTPNFFINGRKLTGAQPVASFEKVIDEELKKAKALVAKGTPRAKVYEETIKNGATKPAAAPQANKRPQEDPNKVYDVPVNPGDAVKGPANAKVTIVEFSEFQCPFCKRVNPTIDQIMKQYGNDVRVVFKHNPLSFHKEAPYASQAALAAGKQGKFWEMHDMLFENQRQLKPEDIEKYAQEIGLNMEKFKADANSDAIKKQIAADQALAAKVGARGTPTFFINGKKLRGAQPFPRFQEKIDEALGKKK